MKRNCLLIIIITITSLLVFIGCDNDYPESLNNDNEEYLSDPIITSISPSDSAYGGTDDRDLVVITGHNFSLKSDEIQVCFGSKYATIYENDTNRLVVELPASFLDSVKVKISVQGALNYGVYNDTIDGAVQPRHYRVLNPVVRVGEYTSDDGDAIGAIAADGNNNLYVVNAKAVDKVAPDGTITTMGEIRPESAVSAKIGPGNLLYYTNAKAYIFKTDFSSGTSVHTYKKLSNLAYDLDFDVNQNLYVVGTGNIYYVNPSTLAPTVLFTAADTTFSTVRIFDGNMYVIGKFSGEGATTAEPSFILKFAVDAANMQLGQYETLMEFNGSDYSTQSITALTFNADGKMYIGVSGGSLLSIEPSTAGSYAISDIHEVYPNVLGTEIFNLMSWGTGDFLYYYNGTTVNKLKMFEESAPYYGRQ